MLFEKCERFGAGGCYVCHRISIARAISLEIAITHAGVQSVPHMVDEEHQEWLKSHNGLSKKPIKRDDEDPVKRTEPSEDEDDDDDEPDEQEATPEE